MENPDGEEEKLSGWRGFLADNFGILLMRRSQERSYEKHQAEYVRLRSMIDDVQGLAYPVRLYPIPEEERRKLVQSLNYMRHYSVWSLMAVFLTLSVFGWLWEVGMHRVSLWRICQPGRAARSLASHLRYRAVLILTMLYRFRGRPVLEFLLYDPFVRLSGIYDFSGDGDCYGRYEMVGLQRIFSQPERQDLRRRTSGIRSRRTCYCICDRSCDRRSGREC